MLHLDVQFILDHLFKNDLIQDQQIDVIHDTCSFLHAFLVLSSTCNEMFEYRPLYNISHVLLTDFICKPE